MKKLFLVIFILFKISGISFADDPDLILKCRMLKDNVKTDIFFEHNLNQSFLFKIFEYNKKEILYKYDNSSTLKYSFNRDTKILNRIENSFCNTKPVKGRKKWK